MKKNLYTSLSLVALMALSTPAFAGGESDDPATTPGAKTAATTSAENAELMQAILAELGTVKASLADTNTQATNAMPESEPADQQSMTSQKAAIDADLTIVEEKVQKGLFQEALDEMKKVTPKLKNFGDEVVRVVNKNAAKAQKAIETN